MQEVFPDYYKNFRCIAGECKHNCCIGWEIDIDSDTLGFYDRVEGGFGERLKGSISKEDTPHFVLGKDERCPFLNERNLCDIIINLGEERLCRICNLHPRFVNSLPERTELGIGLCCEAAARLIIGKKDPVIFEKKGFACDDRIVELRDRAILLLQDREKPIGERAENMLSLCGGKMPELNAEWVEFFLSLERLDEKWTELLNELKADMKNVDFKGFGEFMQGREYEYEQLLVYLIYRHLANACDEADLAARASFTALGYELVYALGAMLWTKNGFSFDDQLELVRMFSAEIEYSEDNMEIILDELY